MRAAGGKERRPRLGESLTAREVELVAGLADGLSNIGIGERLGITEMTVKSHLRRIGFKLGTGDRAGMVGVAFRTGMLPVPDCDPRSATPSMKPEPEPEPEPEPAGIPHLQIPVALYDVLLAVATALVNGKPLPMLRGPALRAVHDARAHVRDPRAALRRAA